MRILKILFLLVLLPLSIQAKIGWTYEECVAHWGHETDHIILQGELDDGTFTQNPMFIFKSSEIPESYVYVRFSVIDGWFEYEKSRVIEESPSKESGF